MAKERKHPKGLAVLFFTEMWERFGFYLMLGIFTLYMIAGKDVGFPGMGFSVEEAADVYGTYLALVYLTPFFGGMLADRVLGYRLSITIGGLLMAAGYIGLSIHSETAFYISLLLIIFGNGFFKPNISALVGNLYDKFPQYKKNKDAGFNIFYMGINIGAFVCNFIAAYLRLNYGWGWAFAAAGIGMLIGLIWFWTGQLYANDIKAADEIKPKRNEDTPLWKIFIMLFLPAFAAGAVGWFVPDLLFGQPIFGHNSTDAFLFFSIPIVIFYINIYRKADNNEKEPIAALLSVMAVVVVFWAIFHQNGSALTLWAEQYTDREIPESVEGITDKLSLDQTVYTQDTITKLDAKGNKIFFDDITKLETGEFKHIDDQNDTVVAYIGPHPYFDNLPEEEWPDNGKMKLFSTELFQSINPGFIIAFTPLVVGFFQFLRRRKREPSTPAKIGYGLLITSLSALVMVAAAILSQNGDIKASAGWLFGVYGVITIGELFLSPMGLSLVSKLSPPRIVALMMGGWFLSTAIGNKLSGVLSGLWNFYDKKAYFFITNSALAMIAVIMIFILLPWLRRVVKEYTGDK